MLLFLFIPSVAFVLSFLIARGMIGYAHKRDLIDRQNDRSSHQFPTPRGGGVGIVIAFILVVALMTAAGYLSPEFSGTLMAGGLPVALVGFCDDHGHIRARWRLLVQFGAAAALLFLSGGFADFMFSGICVPAIVVNLLALISIVWVVNLYNFMDGIDGIATVEAIFVLMAMAAIAFFHGGSHAFIGLCLSLAAACGGFLVLNWSPARVFMGDVGSGFLGMLLASLFIASQKFVPQAGFSAVFLLAPFIVDATFTLSRRLVRGEKIYQPHRQHAYQCMARKLGRHDRVVWRLIAVNLLWVFPLTVLTGFYPDYALFTGAVLFMPLIYGVYKITGQQ